MRTTIGFLTALTVVFVASTALAADATLKWDGVDEEITGWKLYYDTDGPGPPYEGTGLAAGDSPVDIPIEMLDDPMNPEVVLAGFPSCVRTWFALTAYNDAGESDYSNEVEKVIIADVEELTVEPSEPFGFDVSWVGLPSDDAGMIESWNIHWDTDAPQEPYGAPGSPITVTEPAGHIPDLMEGVTYYVAVEATCADGESEFSEAVEAVAPGGASMDPRPMVDPDMGGAEPDTGAGMEPAEMPPLADEGCGCGTLPRGSSSASIWLLIAMFVGGRVRRRLSPKSGRT